MCLTLSMLTCSEGQGGESLSDSRALRRDWEISISSAGQGGTRRSETHKVKWVNRHTVGHYIEMKFYWHFWSFNMNRLTGINSGGWCGRDGKASTYMVCNNALYSCFRRQKYGKNRKTVWKKEKKHTIMLKVQFIQNTIRTPRTLLHGGETLDNT